MSFDDRDGHIWLDGDIVPWREAKVHVLTHTLHYGLGVFEGVRAYKTNSMGTCVFRLEDHTKRLFRSAHIMRMEMPFDQETINKTFPEFLVNFDYLTRLIENYGFTPINSEEAAQIGFLNGIGSVSLLFDRMKNFLKRSRSKSHSDKFGTAPNMNYNEKKISFLNNYFIFKKRRPVNAESVYKSIVKNEKVKKKFKFKKLKKKIKLKMKK